MTPSSFLPRLPYSVPTIGRFISSRIHPFPSEHGSKDAQSLFSTIMFTQMGTSGNLPFYFFYQENFYFLLIYVCSNVPTLEGGPDSDAVSLLYFLCLLVFLFMFFFIDQLLFFLFFFLLFCLLSVLYSRRFHGVVGYHITFTQ